MSTPDVAQIGQQFKCLSFTLEMPFKDTEDSPEPVSGWSPERAKRFGASLLGPIYDVLPILRDVPKPEKIDVHWSALCCLSWRDCSE